MRSIFKMIYKILVLILVLAPVLALTAILAVRAYARPLTFTPEAAPSRPVAIVLGAGLWRDGAPTPVLRDRVAAAAQLFFAGKVKKLLMSGSRSSVYYDEPQAMRKLALTLGVPDEAIVLDGAGLRTYDSCYRARYIYGVREALLVTQQFHLPRAVYLCNALGISAAGVSSDLRQYRSASLFFWNLREIPATLAALWDVYIKPPQIELGLPQPIFPTEAQ